MAEGRRFGRRRGADDGGRRAEVAARLAAHPSLPTVTVVVPVYDPPEEYLRRCLASVRGQWYPATQVVVVDDASTAPHVAAVLDEAAGAPGLTVVRRAANGHIAAACNSGLEVATGQWVTVVDHDDELAPDALAEAVLALAAAPDAGLCYSDEDHLEGGEFVDRYAKPAFDPLLLLGQHYLAHLCLLRRDLVAAAGGFRPGFEGSQDWDLVLRVARQLRPEQVVHVPRTLYHWRRHDDSTARTAAAKPYAADAGRRAVAEHLAAQGLGHQVRVTPPTGHLRVLWSPGPDAPAVSVVVAATTGHTLRRCVDSVLACSTYPSVEVVVVVAPDADDDVAPYLAERAGSVTVVAAPAGSATRTGPLFDAGVAAATGEVLCLVHDDTEVVEDRWLEELVGALLLPGVGAVGARLLAPDGTVRAAGYRLAPDATVHLAGRGRHRLDGGPSGRLALLHSVAATPTVAVALRRAALAAAGGIDADPERSGPAADVDLCRRLWAAGWRVAVQPHAALVHHEKPADGETGVPVPAPAVAARWPAAFADDPSWHPAPEGDDAGDGGPALATAERRWPPVRAVPDAAGSGGAGG